jgi:hypothetical protein
MTRSGQCDQTHLVDQCNADSLDLSQCKEVIYDYDGHGPKPEARFDAFLFCFEAGVCGVRAISEGCREAGNIEEVEDLLRRIQEELEPGEYLSLWMNQGISSDACQAGLTKFTATCNQTTTTLPDCDGACLEQGETSVCAGADGPETQYCCCDPFGANSATACRYQSGECSTDGDSDGDGVCDANDQCPDQGGTVCDGTDPECACIKAARQPVQCGAACAGCEKKVNYLVANQCKDRDQIECAADTDSAALGWFDQSFIGAPFASGDPAEDIEPECEKLLENLTTYYGFRTGLARMACLAGGHEYTAPEPLFTDLLAACRDHALFDIQGYLAVTWLNHEYGNGSCSGTIEGPETMQQDLADSLCESEFGTDYYAVITNHPYQFVGITFEREVTEYGATEYPIVADTGRFYWESNPGDAVSATGDQVLSVTDDARNHCRSLRPAGARHSRMFVRENSREHVLFSEFLEFGYFHQRELHTVCCFSDAEPLVCSNPGF